MYNKILKINLKNSEMQMYNNYEKGLDLCDEVAKILQISPKGVKHFKAAIRYEVKKYSKKDLREDIEQNIFEGLMRLLFKTVVNCNYDLITNAILEKQRKEKITDRKLMRNIVKEYNILDLKKNEGLLIYLIPRITGNIYGVRATKKSDVCSKFTKINTLQMESEIIIQDNSIIELHDADTEIDFSIDYLFDKFFRSISEREKMIFEKYYVDQLKYAELLETEIVRSQYELRTFLLKTSNFFKVQLLEQ